MSLFFVALAAPAHATPTIPLTTVRTDHVRGHTLVRQQPVLDGLPVLNRRHRVGAPTPAPAVRAPASLIPTQSNAVAITSIAPALQSLGRGTLWAPHAQLALWADDDDQAHLVWAVHASLADPMSTWRFVVHAHTGEVLNATRTSFDAQGRIYPFNPVVSKVEDVELLGLDKGAPSLSGEYTYTQSCDAWDPNANFGVGACTKFGVQAIADENGDFLFDPDPAGTPDPFAEVQMYHHVDTAARWFDDRYGFVLPQPILSVANLDVVNAFYGDVNGDTIGDVAFGQTGKTDFAYDADVIYHEYTHAVLVDTIGPPTGLFEADEYGISWATGAINEGAADVFSTLLTEDPVLGEFVGQGLGLGAVRDLEADRRCPDDLLGQSHEDGLVMGSTAWNLIDDPQVGTEVTADLFYRAILDWPSDVSWDDAGQSLTDAAAAFLADETIDQATHDAIQGHLTAANMVGCERVVPLDGGNTHTQLGFYLTLADAIGYMPLQNQVSVDVPAEHGRATLSIDQWDSSSAGLVWRVFVRRGEPVRFAAKTVFGFDLPQAQDYDFFVDGSGTDTVVVDADSEVPLESGERYYFAIAPANDGGLGGFGIAQVFATASASTEAVDAPTEPTDGVTGTDGTDTGGDPATDDAANSGCGCTSGGSAGGWLVLLGVLALRRRR
ncbi:MAG: hypothetical protein KTR31_16725 [Myxococcales bacterium]|nr:hypothetical protein [Myxococcales bacterium]